MGYQSIWEPRKGEILACAEWVRVQFPTTWEELKVPGQTSRRYISLVAEKCRMDVHVDIGCNLKRGGPETSLDVLAMPNPSGCRDATGTFPGLELIDIVFGAEGPSPSLGWGDATQKTIDANVSGGWIKSATTLAPTPPPLILPPGRDEALDEMNWLDAYYASPEGLQRPNGLSLNGKPDFEGVAAWYIDVYQRRRMAGQSRADARAAYVNEIRHSAEWRAKHPGETP